MVNCKERYYKLYIGIALIIAVMSQMPFFTSSVEAVLYCVFMPMIFAVHGANMRENDNTSNEYVKGMFKMYMVPYFWFSLFYLVSDAIKVFSGAIDNGKRITAITGDIVRSILLLGVSSAWYLPVLFLGGILYIVIRKKLGYAGALVITASFSGLIIVLMGDVRGMVVETLQVKSAINMIFVVCWRSVLASFFMVIGEGADKVAKLLKKKGVAIIFAGLIVTALGVVIIFNNRYTEFNMLEIGDYYLYFPGVVLFIMGTMMLACWLSQAAIFEFIGENARIVYLTFIDFGIMNFSFKYVSGLTLNTFHNYFLSYGMGIISFVIVEIIIIVAFNGLLFFAVGKNMNRTFGLIKKEDV